MLRYRSRVDSNQKEIAEVLRKAGFSVFHAHQVGKGFPDLVAGRSGRTWLLEVKIKKGKLTEPQKKFHTEWRGGVIPILESIEDALVFVRSCDEADRAAERAKRTSELPQELARAFLKPL